MSVRIPLVEVPTLPKPEFVPRSRREESTRDIVNARNIELYQSGPQIQQSYFRPETAVANGFGPRRDMSFFDQAPLATRVIPPISIPAPAFDPAGPKMEGNPFFDQHAASYDPRNVARELRAAVKENKTDRGIAESQRLLSRGFSGRYVPEGYSEVEQLNSLQSFELLRPKMDDSMKVYRPM
jgi:hypothetical protein